MTLEHSDTLEEELADLALRAVMATQLPFTIVDLSRPDTPLVFVNPSFERVTGYCSEDVLGRDWRFLQGPDTDLAAVERLNDAILQRMPTTATFLSYRKDGSTFWDEVSVDAFFDERGEEMFMVAVHKDVTDEVVARRDLEGVFSSERTARQQSQATSSHLRAIITSLPSGVMVAEAPSGRLVMGNQQIAEIWRHPFIAASGIDDYSRYVSFHSDGRRYEAREWPLARSLTKGEVVTDEEVVIRRGDGTRGVIVVHSAPVHDDEGNIVAGIALFDDITTRKEAEEELRHAREKSAALAQTLQKALLPADLPEVDGFDFGAAYSPIGEGLEVGGDFYDVFEPRAGEWAVVIGDVMGKGAEAAGVTSLARHALRTASLRLRSPAALLRMLNEALLREGEGHPFATVAAGLVRRTREGARVLLSLGGHPRPFVMRDDGTVEQVGKPGTLLGVVADADLSEIEIDLGAGDTLVMYTDGVTEATTTEGALIGEDGLRSILTEISELELGATCVAKSVLGKVMKLSDEHLRDDIAVLVIKVLRGERTPAHL